LLASRIGAQVKEALVPPLTDDRAALPQQWQPVQPYQGRSRRIHDQLLVVVCVVLGVCGAALGTVGLLSRQWLAALVGAAVCWLPIPVIRRYLSCRLWVSRTGLRVDRVLLPPVVVPWSQVRASVFEATGVEWVSIGADADGRPVLAPLFSRPASWRSTDSDEPAYAALDDLTTSLNRLCGRSTDPLA